MTRSVSLIVRATMCARFFRASGMSLHSTRAKTVLHLAKMVAALGLGLALAGCLTTQAPSLDPAVTTANAAASVRAATPDRETLTNRLLARYDACVRAAFADLYDRNVEKSAAADLAFAGCTADEQALNSWFAEYPVASARIRASMSDRKLRLKAELILQYP